MDRLCHDQTFLSLCHRRPVAALCLLYKVNSNSNYCLFCELPSPSVSVRHYRAAAAAHLLLLLLLLKKIGNARPGEGDCHPISPKTPAPYYQPIEEKKKKGE